MACVIHLAMKSIPKQTDEQIDRLMSKTWRNQSTGCVEWIGAINNRGYGYVRRSNGITYLAHRIVWSHFRGPIDSGLFVCHRCDNPRCVNIDHLFLGTPKDNYDDMVSKGRGDGPAFKGRSVASNVRHSESMRLWHASNPMRWSGERSPRSKLSADQVRLIRSSNLTLVDLARSLGVSKETVRCVRNGKSYKEVV